MVKRAASPADFFNARVIVTAVSFVILFWPTFIWMAERFDAPDSFYSHGWLIPPASGWLIWKNRAALSLSKWRSSVAGFCLLLPSLIIHVFANRWQVHVVSGIALLGVVWGLVWVMSGPLAVKELRFPLFFLVFMVPLPGILLIAISFKMKMMAAFSATQLLNGMHIQATQAGSTIHVPGVSVIVDDACSGLRSLISLLALATFWTALLPAQAKPIQKWAVVACAVPIALAGNMVRIVLLVLIALIYGAKAAEGFLHFGSGIVVFLVAIAALAWVGRLLVPAQGPSKGRAR